MRDVIWENEGRKIFQHNIKTQKLKYDEKSTALYGIFNAHLKYNEILKKKKTLLSHYAC